MELPVRVQRSRNKKNVSPNGLPTIYVGRPSKWGNPFYLFGDMVYINAAHRRKILSKEVCFYDDGGHTIEEVVELYRRIICGEYKSTNPDVDFWIKHFMKLDLTELRGKNLSCWCKPGSPCHGDILLKLVNI